MLKIHIAHFPNDTTSVSDLPNLFVLCDRQDWLALQRSMLEEFAAKKESAEALPGQSCRSHLSCLQLPMCIDCFGLDCESEHVHRAAMLNTPTMVCLCFFKSQETQRNDCPAEHLFLFS